MATFKKLYTNGCSWTNGDGIIEDPLFVHGTRQQDYAWPAVLARHLGIPLINDSNGGCSNKRMMRCVIDFVSGLTSEERESTLVILGWTTTDRDEIFVRSDIGKTDDWFRYNANQDFTSYSDVRETLSATKYKAIEKTRRHYVAHIHTIEAQLVYFFQQFYLLRNLLENLKVPFLFFSALPWQYHLLGTPEQNEFIARWTKTINDSKNVYDINKSFCNFVADNNYPMSSCVHPMIQGHDAWAKLLNTEIIQRGI